MISVTSAMQAAIDSAVQRPLFKLLSYDISQATGETWGAIIDGTATQTATDLTQYVADINWSYEKITVNMADGNAEFHPDGGSLRSVVTQGRGLRLLEGFEGVPEDEWIPTFSGIIQGAYGWTRERGNVHNVSVSAFSRESNQAWKRRFVTSKEFTVGTDWSVLFNSLLTEVMGLDSSEIAVEEPWNLLFDKSVNQIVNVAPWEALTQLAQGNMSRIWFNGNGQLDSYPILLDRVNLVLSDDKLLSVYDQPSGNTELINKVIVVYLDNNLTKVVGAQQSLGTANITTGFFDFETKLDVFWSEDKRQRAENVKLVVKQSINQNDLGISIGSERLDVQDEFGGELVITVDEFVTGLAIGGVYAVLESAFIPDAINIGSETTIPIGRIEQAVGTVAVMLAMMILGTGVYEIVGNPFDYAFLEKQTIALLDNIPFWEEKEKTITNHFISTEERAHQLAVAELLFEQSKGKPRSLVVANDPRIEKGDIIQLATGVKVFVNTATKKIERGQNISMSINGFKSVV